MLPLFGLFLIFHLEEVQVWIPLGEQRNFLYVLTFVSTFFLPLLNALLLLRLNMIDSLEMKTRQERKIPYLVVSIFYFVELYFLVKADVPDLILALMVGATLVVVSVLLINLFWQISAHMAGIGGLTGMMISLSYRLQINLHLILISIFLIAGLVAFSRLKLSAHSAAEVYGGFLLGAGLQLVLFL